MKKFRVMGISLVLLAVLVVVSMAVNSNRLWFVTDILAVATAGACGIRLLKIKHTSNA